MELKEILEKCKKGDRIVSKELQGGGDWLEFDGEELYNKEGYEYSFLCKDILSDWEFYKEEKEKCEACKITVDMIQNGLTKDPRDKGMLHLLKEACKCGGKDE